MKYTVNEINANSDLLPGVKLGYEIYDTCKQSDVIVKPTLLFLTEGSSRKLAIRCNYTNYETRVVAVIGPSISEMASITGKMLGFFLMPQVRLLIGKGSVSHKYWVCLNNKRECISYSQNVLVPPYLYIYIYII